jgi:hypothetical protein
MYDDSHALIDCCIKPSRIYWDESWWPGLERELGTALELALELTAGVGATLGLHGGSYVSKEGRRTTELDRR